MKSVVVTGPDTVEVREVDVPETGPSDVLVRVKACGVCGTDLFYRNIGGAAPRCRTDAARTRARWRSCKNRCGGYGVAVGDHVVINPMAAADGIIGNGGAQGALSEFLLLRDATAGVQFRPIPTAIPWEVAALNEPRRSPSMA